MPVKVGNKILRSLALEPEADEALRKLAEREGIPAAQLLRDGLALIFKEYKVVVKVWASETATNPTRRVSSKVTYGTKRPAPKKK
jgi:hypothetical protein